MNHIQGFRGLYCAVALSALAGTGVAEARTSLSDLQNQINDLRDGYTAMTPLIGDSQVACGEGDGGLVRYSYDGLNLALEICNGFSWVAIETRNPSWEPVVYPDLPGGHVECQKEGDWIRFKGFMYGTGAYVPSGWPTSSSFFLPEECKPLSNFRMVSVACESASSPHGNTCLLGFYSSGEVKVFTDNNISRILFEGVSVWGGADQN